MQALPIPSFPVPLPDAQWDALQLAWSTPPRAYHDWAHLIAVMGHYHEVSAAAGWTHPVESGLAVLYHDAVYEPGRGDNEARSADLAREHIAHWLSDVADPVRVADLVLLTARHGSLVPGEVDRDAALFLDCDMAILGADPAAFDAYDRGIASEYRGQVPGWLYRLNRRRFLKGLLARERIFLSDLFHQRYDARARQNLRRAVNRKQ